MDYIPHEVYRGHTESDTIEQLSQKICIFLPGKPNKPFFFFLF